jgi:hypothetical protein
MCHSFIRVSLAQVARNLSAGNSRETVARKTINKPTTTLVVSVQLMQEFTLHGLTTRLFSSPAPILLQLRSRIFPPMGTLQAPNSLSMPKLD